MSPEKAEASKTITDLAAITAAFGTWLTTWVPVIASVLSIVWLCMRIYDWIEERFLKKEKGETNES